MAAGVETIHPSLARENYVCSAKGFPSVHSKIVSCCFRGSADRSFVCNLHKREGRCDLRLLRADKNFLSLSLPRGLV